MTIELFALGEYVSNNNGRLSIIDTLDSIVAERFPWRAYFGVALKMKVSADEPQREQLTMQIVSDKNKSVVFEASTRLMPPKEQKETKLVMASNLKGLIFPEPDMYHFRLIADSDLVADYVFEVKGVK